MYSLILLFLQLNLVVIYKVELLSNILVICLFVCFFDGISICFRNQALVDSPDMVRSQMNFKRLSLTDIKIDIKRVPKKKTLIAAMEAAGGC